MALNRNRVGNRNRAGIRFAGLVVAAVLSTGSMTACGEQSAPPQLPAAPPASKLAPQPGISAITPEFRELQLNRSAEPAETLPWHLIRLDLNENRVYLSASSVMCTTPEKVRLIETASEIKISVTGTRRSEPCTAQSITLVGYVQLGSIGGRQVTGDSS